MDQNRPLRIFIVEDHDLIRQNLSLLMSRRPGLEVVGEAATAAEALEKLPGLEPDIVLVKVHLPDRSGIELSREIRASYPNARILILTTHGDDRAVISSVLAGASGYLLRGFRSQELIDAIRRVARGQRLLEPSIMQRVLARVCSGVEEDEECCLTTEERRVLEMVAQGKTDQEIAAEVSLQESVVKGYVTTIYSKLEVIRRTQSSTYSVTWRTRQRIV